MSERKKVAEHSLNTIPKAFTLAEVLITLAIIGVVAALTIPAVVRNYEKHVMETRLKKIYSQILQAFNTAQVENSDPQHWETVQGINGSGDFAQKYLFPYLKVIKNCGTSSTGADCNYKYRYKNSTSWTTPVDYYTRFFLKDGTFIAMYVFKASGYVYISSNQWVMFTGRTSPPTAAQLASWGYSGFTYYGMQAINEATFIIDINGSKGPNVVGRDVFWFTFYGSGNSETTPAGVKTTNANNGKFVPECQGYSKEDLKNYCNEYGSCCAAYIMANGWKVPDDYSFN